MRHFGSKVIKNLVFLSGIVTFSVLIFIVGYILVRGLPYLKPSLFEWEYNSENVSMLPAIINTVILTLCSLVLAIPFGVFTAIYLVEYAGRGNKIVEIIRLTTETLSGIPSIVYGLFGSLFFVSYLNMGYSILAGALTMFIMVLPVIIRTTEEALKAVPDMYREASFGVGAGRLVTIFKIVLPSAMNGIVAGIILAIGRIVGETAALLYTSSSAAKAANGLLSSGRTLAVHMYALSGEGLYTNEAFATAVVLLLFVLIINTSSALIARRIGK